MTLEDDLSLALALADAADTITQRRFGAVDLVIDTKPDLSPVSDADRAVEESLRGRLERARPEDAVWGEEFGQVGDSSRRWVIDPIDGTTPFLSGLADWCVSIAIAVEGEPVIGVIEAPRHRETWVAGQGRGATVNGTALRINPEADLTSGMFAFGGSLRCDPVETGGFVTRLMQSGCIAFHNGSGALMTAYVAGGRLVGYYDAHIKPWDCFAGLVMVSEAGGVFSFGDGDRLQNGGPLLVGAERPEGASEWANVPSATVSATAEEIRSRPRRR